MIALTSVEGLASCLDSPSASVDIFTEFTRNGKYDLGKHDMETALRQLERST
jgi:hypothetical protein